MKKKTTRYETKLPVKLTLRERDLIRSGTFPDPDFGKEGVIDGKNITVDLSLDEIEEIQGYVAADANDTDNSKLEKELDRLFGRHVPRMPCLVGGVPACRQAGRGAIKTTFPSREASACGRGASQVAGPSGYV